MSPTGEPSRLDLRLAAPAAAAWLSAYFMLSARPIWGMWLGLAGAAVTLAALFLTRPAARFSLRPWQTAVLLVAAMAGVGLTLGAVATSTRTAVRDSSPLVDRAREHASIRARLALTDDPRIVAAGGGSPTYLIAAKLLSTAGGSTVEPWARGGERIVAFAQGAVWSKLLPGQRVNVSGRLAPATRHDLTAATLSIRGEPQLVGRPPLMQRGAGALRTGLREAARVVPQPAGGLIPALAVGDTSILDPGLVEQFRVAGLTHLTAVSGANLALIVGAVVLALQWLGAGRRSCALLAGLTVIGFVVLARPSPSVLRAAVMAGIGLAALAMGRPRHAFSALAVAVIGLVIVDPALAASPGFALSALATAGLVLFAPTWVAVLRRRGAPRVLAEALAVPVAAQVMCAPLIVAISGTVSIVAVPANMIAALFVGPVTVLGVAAAVCSVVAAPVGPALAAAAAWAAGWPAKGLVGVAGYATRPDYAELSWPVGLWGAVLLSMVILLIWLALRYPLSRGVCLAVVVGLLLVMLPAQLLIRSWPPSGWLMTVCDVGQGDASVLRAGQGTAVVIDAGPDPAGVDGCLDRLGVRRVSLFVLSHPHADHVGGIDGVGRGRRIDEMLVGEAHEPASGYRQLARAAGRAHAAITTVVPGWRRVIGAVELAVLAPTTLLHGTRSDPNNNSIVVSVRIGSVTALFPGDVEREAQDELLAEQSLPRVDVLKVPHHGSPYSEPAFFDTVRPRIALVSVGAHNRYGHPSPTVLRYLRRQGALVRRTDLDGDIAVISSGAGVTVAHRGKR